MTYTIWSNNHVGITEEVLDTDLGYYIGLKTAIEYKLNGFNVINDFNRIVKENYRKQRREKFITIKIKFNDLDCVINLLKNNNIFVERVTKNK